MISGSLDFCVSIKLINKITICLKDMKYFTARRRSEIIPLRKWPFDFRYDKPVRDSKKIRMICWSTNGRKRTVSMTER